MRPDLKWCEYPGDGTVQCPECVRNIERVLVNVATEDMEIYCEECGSSIDSVVEEDGGRPERSRAPFE